MYFAQFRSGTEEEYDHLKSLLEDMTVSVDVMPVVNVVKQKKKDEQDKAIGLAMRKATMETNTSKCACKNELFYRRFSSQLLNTMVFEVN